jgi:hypothetical protein
MSEYFIYHSKIKQKNNIVFEINNKPIQKQNIFDRPKYNEFLYYISQNNRNIIYDELIPSPIPESDLDTCNPPETETTPTPTVDVTITPTTEATPTVDETPTPTMDVTPTPTLF